MPESCSYQSVFHNLSHIVHSTHCGIVLFTMLTFVSYLIIYSLKPVDWMLFLFFFLLLMLTQSYGMIIVPVDLLRGKRDTEEELRAIRLRRERNEEQRRRLERRVRDLIRFCYSLYCVQTVVIRFGRADCFTCNYLSSFNWAVLRTLMSLLGL